MGERDRRPALAAAGVVLVAGGVGVATSFLQTVLPYAVAPLANSAGSWCLVAWLLARPAPTPVGGVLGPHRRTGRPAAGRRRGLVADGRTSTAYWVGEGVVGLLLGVALLARGPRHT